ncbi:MAG: nitroreductase family protein [Sedimentisphaerales bacterium]|nr:nitroreductase family protein [Sedimentisphaerales bacterium]
MRQAISTLMVLALGSAACQAQGITAGPLPAPIVTRNSLELCLNSRYSQHSLGGTASAQQVSNILWAAGRMPVTGSYRNIYLVAPGGTYLYDPNSHSLTWSSDERTSEGAFAIRYEAELAFDAGVMFMPAMLASVSLCSSTEPAVACCPKGLGLPTTRLFFGVQAGKALTSTLAVHSSAPQDQSGWLPDPCSAGRDSLEEVLAHLKYTDSFVQTDLTLRQVSQILWAGYGCTAHTTSNGKAGLTVPSAYASYYLTRSIYIVKEGGVYRYLNRNPATNTSTKDHRIEPVVAAASGRGRPPADPQPDDARVRLRSAVGGLPQAPCYVILCLDSANVNQEFAQLETGFIAGNMLLQASALGLSCHFKPKLSATERKNIQAATNIPASHVPQAIVSMGPAGARVSVSVTLQGEARPDAGWTVPLTVRFFAPGAHVLTDTPVNEFRLTTSRSATADTAVCEAVGVLPATYDIAVFAESTLMNVRREVVLSAPGASVDLGILLEGDANRDNTIDLGDCAILSAFWLASVDQPQYDLRADFDRNGLVNAADLSLLADNWLMSSPIEGLR